MTRCLQNDHLCVSVIKDISIYNLYWGCAMGVTLGLSH
jgi:hypothetical protein